MPTLNVSEILTHAELADTFTVRRRQETVNIHGRSTVQETLFAGVVGVVTMASPNDLDRQDDKQFAGRTITVVCKFKLRTATDQYQPDIVVWRGDNYVVATIESYPQFGEGFVQATCTSMDKMDISFDPLMTGRLLGNQIRDSLNIVALIC